MRNSKRDLWNNRRDEIAGILKADFSYSLMNNTKWVEGLGVLQEFKLIHRVKLIDRQAPSDWGYLQICKDSSIPHPFAEGCGYSPFKFVDIEWLEAELFERTGGSAARQIHHLQDVEARFREIGIPYTLENGHIRITGHQRQAKHISDSA